MNYLRQLSRAAACCALVTAIPACSDKIVEPKGEPGIRVVSGAEIADTVETFLAQPLVIEVRRVGGEVAANVPVQFDLVPVGTFPNAADRSLYICKETVAACGVSSFAITLYDTTDGAGRAEVYLRLGRKAGTGRLQLSVPTLGFIDTVSYTVNPGAAKSVGAQTPDLSVNVGSTATVSGRVLDRNGNARTEVVTLSAGPGTSITLNTATGTATGTAIGAQYVYFRQGNLADSTLVRVVPPGRLVAMTGTDLHLVNTDGSNVKVLATGLSQFQINPSFFPRFDALRQRVSFQSGTNVGQVNAAVLDTATLASRSIDGTTGINSIMVTRVLADGTFLVLAQRNNVPGLTLFRIESNNTATPLGNIPGLVSTNGLSDISPDGTRVVYGITSAPSNTLVLKIATVATGAVASYEAGISFPRWSRTGDKIAFGATNGLAIMNADGTGRRLVSSTVPTGLLAWSSDDAYILATVGSTLRAIRVADGVSVDLRFRNAAGANVVYREPDWR